MGFNTNNDSFWNISDVNPAGGALHLRGMPSPDGVEQIAFGPVFDPGDGPLSIMTVDVNIQGEDTQFEVQPQNLDLGSIVTIVRFNGDGSIVIADALPTPAFIPIDAPTPVSYTHLTLPTIYSV